VREPPQTIYFVTTDKLPDEKRVYGPKRPSRFYERLAQAKLFLSFHRDRPHRTYKGTITWEEIEA